MEYWKDILLYYLDFKHFKLIICQTPYTLALYIRFYIYYELQHQVIETFNEKLTRLWELNSVDVQKLWVENQYWIISLLLEQRCQSFVGGKL